MRAELYQEFEDASIGTGVAIGDYDGDGRPDIFVVSKTESCRLFRNLGNFKFEDVTEKAGVGDKGAAAMIWKQGATFVDVNNDGLLDIYVCRFNAPNLLYINQGDGTFKEMAHAYGLDVNDSSVMAAFCDYDRDGWLDVYIATNILDIVKHPNGQRGYLFHNNRNGTFTNVTERAGISGETQSHSATWWDYDNDGWPDLYVANDYGLPGQPLPQQPRRDVHQRPRSRRAAHVVFLDGLGCGRREQRRAHRPPCRRHGRDHPPEGPAHDGRRARENRGGSRTIPPWRRNTTAARCC